MKYLNKQFSVRDITGKIFAHVSTERIGDFLAKLGLGSGFECVYG